MERRDLLTSLYMLLRVLFILSRIPSNTFVVFLIAITVCFVQATVLDQGLEGLEADLVAEIQSYLEDLIASGLRKRFISLIKV